MRTTTARQLKTDRGSHGHAAEQRPAAPRPAPRGMPGSAPDPSARNRQRRHDPVDPALSGWPHLSGVREWGVAPPRRGCWYASDPAQGYWSTAGCLDSGLHGDAVRGGLRRGTRPCRRARRRVRASAFGPRLHRRQRRLLRPLEVPAGDCAGRAAAGSRAGPCPPAGVWQDWIGRADQRAGRRWRARGRAHRSAGGGARVGPASVGGEAPDPRGPAP